MTLLETAQAEIERLRDEGLEQWPLAVDARRKLDQIRDSVEALDALGWTAFIERERTRVESGSARTVRPIDG